ncbi:Ig-like domain-containing protein [Chiayiivirga flava]|uniref:Tandem-95 repeat protein n=1 Tax=Chiayiivirga flava TaxID=659595 RepID=A0A7W8D827_9GAMM|nr:Ig-like domain-containing protein [Chiayiivirga flava]MBB5209654.1 hypothetical protein [Chiayiivirga flava]
MHRTPSRIHAARSPGFALVAATLLLAAEGAIGGSCPGTAPGGFQVGTFPSDLNQGLSVCTTPAYNTCQSCNYSATGVNSSTCNNAECSTATCYCVSVAVTPNPPVGADDVARVARNRASEIPVLANDNASGGPRLAVADVGPAVHGTVVLAAGRVVYTPDAGYAGEDDFIYRIVNGRSGVGTATVTLTVTDDLLRDGFE